MTMDSVLGKVDRALVLCPHTDDEFGCAGTLVRLVEAGVELRYVALSRCEESVPDGFEKDVLEVECRECTSRIGLLPENVEVNGFPVRHFPNHRQEILQNFVDLNRQYRPQLVLLPSSSDHHQDHRTVYEEGFRAFKHSSILGYELPQNVISFENSAFVALSQEILKRKIDALSAYASQRNRSYASRDFVEGLARVRGVQAGCSLAEAFEVIRLVVR